MQAIVSIHDVMPSTAGQVEGILDRLEALGVPPPTLLVVPGKPWRAHGLDWLRALARRGHPLAAHGWHHQTTPRKLFHRFHSALISRDVAEHLDLDGAGILELMVRAQAWFIENDLPVPELYVPPAWALGFVSRRRLLKAPYRRIETTAGIRCLNPARSSIAFSRLPLAGYEADTRLRAAFLRRWNAAQARYAARSGRPLRISIHPNDLKLRLADQLDAQIKAASSFLDYDGTIRCPHAVPTNDPS